MKVSSVRIQTDATERVEVMILDDSLDPLTGKTDILLSIRRVSDGFWYDFNDDTFKSAGWTTRQQAMSEVSATNAPGEYYYDFDTSAITNDTADDTYQLRVDQSPGTDAANLPQTGEIKVGQWADQIDDIETDTQDIQTRLPAALVGGRMDSDVGNIQAGAVDASAIDTDAIDADALAADAVAEIVAAMNDLDAQEVRDAMKLAPTGGAPGIGSVDEHLDDILADTAAMQPLVDVAVSTRATQADILSDATPFAGANIDAAISSRAAPGDEMALVDDAITSSKYDESTAYPLVQADTGASAVARTGADADTLETLSDEIASVQSDTDDIQTRLPAALVGGRMDSDVGNMQADTVDASAIAVNAIGASELAQSAVDEIRDGILADSTPFNGANIDAAVSTRAAPGDEMNLADDAITNAKYDETTAFPIESVDSGSTELARTGADGDTLETISDQIDGLPTAAAIVSDVWSEALPGAYGVGEAGKIVGDNLDAAISSRAAPGDAMDLVADAVDTAAIATDAIDADALAADAVAEIQSGLSTFDPSTDEVDVGEVKGVAVTGVDDFKADVSLLALEANVQGHAQAALTAQGYTAARAPGLDNLDASVSSRAAPGDEMNLSDDAITAAKYDETTAFPLASVDSGSTEVARTGADGDTLETISDQIDGISSSGWTSGEKEQLRDAMGIDGAKTAATGGQLQDVVDDLNNPNQYKADVSSLSTFDPSTDEVDVGEIKGTVVTGPDDLKADVSALALEANVQGHAAAALTAYDPPTRTEATADKNEIITEVNANETKIDALPSAVDNADAVWDEDKTGHIGADTFGQEVQSHATPTEVKTQADQALTDYDPPTRAEATSDKNEIITEVDANETKIDAVLADTSAMEPQVEFIKSIEEGRWELTSEGGGTWKVYKADNTTLIATFATFDSKGVRTYDPTEIVKRVRIS